MSEFKFFPYFGNKKKEINYIAKYLPKTPIKRIIDVFGGSGAAGILVKDRLGKDKELIYTDNNLKLIKLVLLYKNIYKEKQFKTELDKWNNGRQNSIDEYDLETCKKKIINKMKNIKDKNVQFIIMGNHSIFGTYLIKDDAKFAPICEKKDGKYHARQVFIDYEKFNHTYDTINKVYKSDYKTTLSHFKKSTDFLYLDPPYFEGNIKYNNTFNMKDAEYIFEYMSKTPSRVMLNVDYAPYKPLLNKYKNTKVKLKNKYSNKYNTVGHNETNHCIITNY